MDMYKMTKRIEGIKGADDKQLSECEDQSLMDEDLSKKLVTNRYTVN